MINSSRFNRVFAAQEKVLRRIDFLSITDKPTSFKRELAGIRRIFEKFTFRKIKGAWNRKGPCPYSTSRAPRRVRRPQATKGSKSCSPAACTSENIHIRTRVCESSASADDECMKRSAILLSEKPAGIFRQTKGHGTAKVHAPTRFGRTRPIMTCTKWQVGRRSPSSLLPTSTRRQSAGGRSANRRRSSNVPLKKCGSKRTHTHQAGSAQSSSGSSSYSCSISSR